MSSSGSSFSLAIFNRFLGLGVAASASCAPGAVEAGVENGDDRENVLGQLAFGGGREVVCLHVDLRSVLTEYVLDKIVCEAAPGVAMGNAHEL